MKISAEIYKFIRANHSLEKLLEQDINYPIKTAYNLIRTKDKLDDAIDYVMKRLSSVCGDDIDFEDLSNKDNSILNTILNQEIEIELPDIDVNCIVNVDNVNSTVSDVNNILFLFQKREG